MDGNSSRWNLAALHYLRQNNVFAICIPSHTSIWAQPNDAGVNGALKHALGPLRVDFVSPSPSAPPP